MAGMASIDPLPERMETWTEGGTQWSPEGGGRNQRSHLQSRREGYRTVGCTNGFQRMKASRFVLQKHCWIADTAVPFKARKSVYRKTTRFGV
jgi:hypothetical protein